MASTAKRTKVYRVFAASDRAIKIRAHTPREAAIAAVKTGRFRALGDLLRIETSPPTVAWYMDSVTVCKDAGMWRD